MNIVLLLAHAIEESDQIRLLSSLGHSVFSIGAYIEPRHPHVDIRPPIDLDTQTDLKAAVDALGQPHPDVEGHTVAVPTGRTLGPCSEGHADPMEAARRWLPDDILDWADVIICHHLEHTWLVPQWSRIRHKRVIWRTVGQSAAPNEWMMAPLRADGLEIIRYSPKERNLPGFAGEDALIRFYKDPEEWKDWEGSIPAVLNVTQKLYQRSLADDGELQRPGWQWTSYTFWERATEGLDKYEAGPKDDAGRDQLTVEDMKAGLRLHRCYLYTGTQPASYTLGLIEALMTGIPVVSIGPGWHRILPYGPLLFEGHELAPFGTDSPEKANVMLRALLNDADLARSVSVAQRKAAIATFGMETIAEQWAGYLAGVPAMAVAA